MDVIMELRQLLIFRTAAQTLNFTQTASMLGYVQSNITAQIKALEEEFGVPLFDRLGRQVVLTDAGKRLLDYAEELLDMADEAHHVVSNNRAMEGEVLFSAPETICVYRLPGMLRTYRDTFPAVKLRFCSMPSEDQLEAVRAGQIDTAIIIVEEEIQAKSLCFETLVKEPLMMVAAPDHPLAGETDLTPLDLDGMTFLVTEKTCNYRRTFERHLLAEGIYPSLEIEFHSVEAIKQCAIAGLGIAILPHVAVKQALACGDLIALDILNLPLIQTVMLWHRDKWLSPPAKAFLDMARKMIQGESLPIQT
jgi:DNA-binding transcriptional LysR family regulator